MIQNTISSDTEALAAKLRAQVRGEMRFDEGSRALYTTDSSNYRQVPIGVVIPRDVDDVTHTVAACRYYGAPLLARGAGTSLAGQCCNVAVVIDMSNWGLDYTVLDSGCCGIAEAFGFEKDHYDVSIKVGERVLLPAVRSADKDTLTISDGFSCRETDRSTDKPSCTTFSGSHTDGYFFSFILNQDIRRCRFIRHATN